MTLSVLVTGVAIWPILASQTLGSSGMPKYEPEPVAITRPIGPMEMLLQVKPGKGGRAETVKTGGGGGKTTCGGLTLESGAGGDVFIAEGTIGGTMGLIVGGV